MTDMLEAVSRLREEVKWLKIENRKLENVYLANGISRLAKKNDEDQLTKWVNETLENTSSYEPFLDPEDTRTVYLLSKTLGWSLDSCFCNTKLCDDGKSEKTWQTKWTHKLFQDISKVNLEFTVVKGLNINTDLVL